MGKFCPNQKLFIPLEIPQNANIEIEFEVSIWNFELGIMAKRKARSQIGNNYNQLQPIVHPTTKSQEIKTKQLLMETCDMALKKAY
jgi:hypothetical protein